LPSLTTKQRVELLTLDRKARAPSCGRGNEALDRVAGRAWGRPGDYFNSGSFEWTAL